MSRNSHFGQISFADRRLAAIVLESQEREARGDFEGMLALTAQLSMSRPQQSERQTVNCDRRESRHFAA
jgi:hypothetical protein